MKVRISSRRRTHEKIVFVVCEHHEYSDVNSVIGLFTDRSKAEDAIRSRGEVLCWREPYFMPFALVWAQVSTTYFGEPVRSWCWIEEHGLAEPPARREPGMVTEAIVMGICAFLIMALVTYDAHTPLTRALALTICGGVIWSWVSAFCKA